jgi:hypothetical protein
MTVRYFKHSLPRFTQIAVYIFFRVLATDLQAIMLDCNALAGRQRKFIVGMCVVPEIEGTVSLLPKGEKVTDV